MAKGRSGSQHFAGPGLATADDCERRVGFEERKVGFTENTAMRHSVRRICVCITKTEKAESEAHRSKPKGALGSESRNAIL